MRLSFFWITVFLYFFLSFAQEGDLLSAAETQVTEIGSATLTITIDWISQVRAHAEAETFIPVSPQRVWEILTDYDHLADFAPYLTSSRVIRREPERLFLHQEGGIWFAFYRLKVQTTFEVKEVYPEEIFFKAVEGDFAVYEGRWKLKPDNEGTWMSYEVIVEPRFWVPRWALNLMERQTLKNTFRAILRRCVTSSAQKKST